MEVIQKQARRAQGRLSVHRFLRIAPWCFLTYLAAAACAILVPRIVFVDVDPKVWMIAWVASCSALALIHSLILTWIGRPSLLASAIEIDRRFGLRERVSSTLALQPADAESELGRALVADATKRVERIDLRDQFPLGFHRWLALPILPVALVAGFYFLPLALPPELIAQQEESKAAVQQVKNSTAPLLKQIKKSRALAEEKGLTEAADLFKELESKLEKLQNSNLNKKEALAKLNEIKQEMQKRRDEVGTGEKLQKKLDSLKDLSNGPAEKVAKALEEGNFDEAKNELDKLLDKMKAGDLSANEQKQLSEQLSQLEKALDQASEQAEQAKKELEEKLEKAEQAGDSQEAAELRKELSELASASAQMEKMQQMADKLGKAKKALDNGDMQAAQEDLEELAEQLQQMQQDAEEMEKLDEALEELSESKDSMSCKECNGEGCEKCQGGNKQGKGKKGKGKGKFGDKQSMPGDGLGEGRGQGERPEEEDDTDTFDSQLRDKMKAGETVVAGKIDGPNRKNASKEDVKQAIASSVIDDSEALESEELPKLQRDQTREYFNTLREGKAASEPKSESPDAE